MSDQITDIVVPILRGLQSDVGSLKSDMAMLKESVRRIDSRIGAMESYMAGFHNSLRWQGDELDTQRGRIESLEDKHRPPPSPPEK